MIYIDLIETSEQLSESAPYIREQLAKDQEFSTEQVTSALYQWLEAAIADLVEDAIFHCVSGAEPYTVGRTQFEAALKQQQRR